MPLLHRRSPLAVAVPFPPSIRRRLALLALLLPLLAGPTSCSRIYRDSTPFGEADYRVDTTVNADRVNGWPLFYHRGDATSVLWPVYQATRDGHVVFPLYEYEKRDKDLRVLFGAAAELAFGRGGYRVATGGWNTRNDQAYLFPLFYADAQKKKFLSFPFSYKPAGKPFPDSEGFVNVMLLNSYWRQGKRWSLWSPWPLVHSWNRCKGAGSMAFPLYYYDRPTGGGSRFVSLPYWRFSQPRRTLTNLGPALYLRSTDKDRTHTSVGWLYHAWSGPGEDKQVLAPLFYRAERPDGRRDFYSAFYSQSVGPDGTMRNVGGPIFTATDRQGERYASALWPLYQRWRSPKSSADLLLPFFYTRRDENGSRTVTPFFAYNRTENTSYLSALWLLYNHSEMPGRAWTVTPFGAWGHNDHAKSSFLNVGGILYDQWNGAHSNGRFVTPLFGYREVLHTNGARCWWALPAGWYERDGEGQRFRSLPFSCELDSQARWKNWQIGALLLQAENGPEKQGVRAGLLAGYERSRPKGLEAKAGSNEMRLSALSLFPFFTWNGPALSQADRDKLTATYRAKVAAREEFSDHRSSSWSLGVVMGGDSRFSAYGRPDKDGNYTIYSRDPRPPANDGSPEPAPEDLFAPEIRRSFHAFPVYESYSPRDGQSEAKALFGLLWKSEHSPVWVNNEKTDSVHRRFLWKVWDYERTATATTVDAFPFLTWDRDTKRDYHAFSFLGPVLRRQAEGDLRSWRIFGFHAGDTIPLVREKDAPPKD